MEGAWAAAGSAEAAGAAARARSTAKRVRMPNRFAWNRSLDNWPWGAAAPEPRVEPLAADPLRSRPAVNSLPQ
jgi:hypothetical protein